jgi:hypothetical protein
MMKLVASCIWVCGVTLAASYVASTWTIEHAVRVETSKPGEGLQYRKTSAIDVPMIKNGDVAGYVVAQFAYTIDATTLKQLPVPPDVFIIDEAFRTIFSQDVDFDHLERYDLTALTTQLLHKVNERLGGELVKDMLVDEFNFVPKREISQ